MSTLTKSDKLQLIESRMRNLEYMKYGLELDIIVENAKSEPVAESITVINESIAEIDDQITALNSELAVVNALTE